MLSETYSMKVERHLERSFPLSYQKVKPYYRENAFDSRSEADLRPIPEQELWKLPELVDSALICSKCRKRLQIYQPPSLDNELGESEPFSDKPSSQGSTVEFVDEDISMDVYLGVSPVTRKRSYNESYMGSKLSEFQEAVRKKFKSQYGIEPATETDKNVEDYREIIQNLKNDIRHSDQRSQKTQLLSLLPHSWSRQKIVEEFGVTDHSVKNSKLLRKKRGTADDAEENVRGRPSLDPSIKDKIVQFYLNDENSRQMPGKSDCKSVIQADGKRKLMQKKLILCNLKELYESYKTEYPEDKVSLSKFCELRPKQCVLAGSSGTHTVCVCVIHENVSLMLEGCKFKRLFKNSSFFGGDDVSVNDILRKMICPNPTMACYEQKCNKCPSIDLIHEHMAEIFEKNDVDEVNYRMWTTTDRCTIFNVNQDTDDFLELLMSNMKKLLLHDFIARNQAKFFSHVKETLQPGWFCVVFDFAENIAFLAQRAIPGFHWNNEQATLFPITVYFKVNGELHHYSYCAISNCLKHDSVAVYMYQKKLIELMKIRFGILLRMIYFSDGAPQQFKNLKSFGNLTYHHSDFGVEAEWNFFATSHGKGPCDGLAGCIKRNAARASLQGHLILNAEQLFEWAKNAMKNVEFFYLSQEDYEETRRFLERERFPFCKTVQGTQGYHAFTPLQNPSGHVSVKKISNSNESKIVKVVTKP
ncbi:hypothetical protein QAD02_012404 [Eretmocerus hayati]|uniref:Uncharacterized protein n=1 Tax=Eretmocerus hayati TaxID=131215 RepID=A0ACC2P2D1_9HYME|nr:hypothetical protein QAD02_012404 [Eretmocerus hayati]